MSVEIEPLELGFHRPFTVEVSQALKIKNPSPRPIAFKVKTTAPKQYEAPDPNPRYCVRPNSGRVEPGAEVEVQVLLQAMKQEPPLDARCKDKFLVQSVSISTDLEFSNVSTLWHQFDGDKSAIAEKKIRVQWLPAESSNHLPAVTPTKPTSHDSLTTPNTDAHSFSSPGDESQIADTTALPEMSSSPEPVAAKETKSDSEPPAPKGKSSYEELESRLQHAEATIVRLKDDGGIRQRKGASASNEKSSPPQMAMQERQSSGGVPLNIVAAIALFSFLLAYFFF
ncbi:Vesicle-associated protein 2-2 [Zalerion maritima]|uniref:Vesicle-associated protein 2-2 n=1 Tax=Zalerion maritima TaxID=339359 RepID=A0AAD5RSJ8_9PEZI|nr:Vesicle-associated protein 2-2 [Zalerion maritima]